METLSKVNEQKDNILASSETLSPSGTLERGFMEKVRSKTEFLSEFVNTLMCIRDMDAAFLWKNI